MSTHRVVHHHQASNFAEKSVGVVGPLGEHGGHVVAAASATSEAAVSTSFSCFGALCSVVRAATDYCRYGNLKQYLLIDPNTGEPLKDTIYTASHLTTEVFILLIYRIRPLDINHFEKKVLKYFGSNQHPNKIRLRKNLETESRIYIQPNLFY